MTDRTRAVVLAYLDALNAGDPDRIAACVTDDFHNEHTSSIGHSLRGRVAYRERLPQFLDQFADLRYEVEDLLVDGDRAVAAYRMTFRWVDDVDRLVHPVTIRGVFRFRVAGGAIVHRVDYWDSGELRRQITPTTSTASATPTTSTSGAS